MFPWHWLLWQKACVCVSVCVCKACGGGVCVCVCVRERQHVRALAAGLGQALWAPFFPTAQLPALKQGSTRETTDTCFASGVSYPSLCPLWPWWVPEMDLSFSPRPPPSILFLPGPILFPSQRPSYLHPYLPGEPWARQLWAGLPHLILGTCDIWRHSLLFLPGRMGVPGPCPEGSLLGHKKGELSECCPG